VKITVKDHSATRSAPPKAVRSVATLSATTAATLSRIRTKSAMSNARPAGVPASKMIS